MKATAVAPANIAFIKYWGQKNPRINLPFNDSLSMNLSNCLTTTTVEFSAKYQKDTIQFLDKKRYMPNFVNEKTYNRVIKHLDFIRKLAKSSLKTKVVSYNSFPSDSGIASSASGFAALTLAATSALGLKLSPKELSSLARLGSGSASRSIPDGFVQWQKGKDHQSSFASSLAGPNWRNLVDIVVIVSKEKKKHSSLSGHSLAPTSPYFKTRLKELPQRLEKVKKAVKGRNLRLLGETIEEEAVDLHVIAMTSKPPIFYWNGLTIEIIRKIKEWREKDGLSAYFTIDAGPNLHIICKRKQEEELNRRLKNVPGVLETIINYPAKGARLTDKHLF